MHVFSPPAPYSVIEKQHLLWESLSTKCPSKAQQWEGKSGSDPGPNILTVDLGALLSLNALTRCCKVRQPGQGGAQIKL